MYITKHSYLFFSHLLLLFPLFDITLNLFVFIYTEFYTFDKKVNIHFIFKK
jgi:hypothetical protein